MRKKAALTYDVENRMTSALSSVNYTYDGNDWRVEKSDGDILWYDPAANHELADVFDLSGKLKAEYYYLGGLLIASRSYFYYSHHLNTVRVMTDSTGNVQFESDFYPSAVIANCEGAKPTITCPPAQLRGDWSTIRGQTD